MAATVGRTIGVYVGQSPSQVLVAGVRTKSLNNSGEPVNITNDDSAGWRALLDVPSVNEIEISVSGVMETDALRAAWYSGSRMNHMAFVYPDGGEVSGDFYMSSYNETGEHDGEVTFEATFLSSGVITYTPAEESSS